MPSLLTQRDLARLIEHQLLKPGASRQDIDTACAEARQHGFYSLWVNGSRVTRAVALLEDSEVKVATVIGFPLGAMDADAKRYETEVAIDNGAQEINVVPNIGWLKEGEHAALLRELRDVVEAADERPLGVILDSGLLSHTEKVRAGELAKEAGAKSIIIGIILGPANLLTEEVKDLRGTVGANFGITAAGHILDARTAIAVLESGATRLATTTGPAILDAFDSGHN